MPNNYTNTDIVMQDFRQFNRNFFQRLGIGIWNYIKGVGLMLWGVIKALPFKLWGLIKAFGLGCKNLVMRFIQGNWAVRLSYLIMGMGGFAYGQYATGAMYLVLEALFIVFFILLGLPNLSLLGTLGTQGSGFNEDFEIVPGDNSVTILLFSVMTFIFLLFFIIMYVKNTKTAEANFLAVKNGEKPAGFKLQLKHALNDRFSTTILILPILGVVIINVLPLLTNVLTAFTNYDSNHSPPGALFTWVGFSNFTALFGSTAVSSFGYTFWNVLGWTLIWAFFATFTNYIAGIIVALMINKKTIKLKAFWRTCFVLTIAIPQFISLLIVSKMFGDMGIINQYIIKWGGTAVPFLSQTSGLLPRVMVIIINMWVGIPYTILSSTGVLMNIPADLYESARIDGAGPFTQFFKITMPYMLFVTAPQLITTFTGNINNFNVIFLLTGGGPVASDYAYSAGKTDLLITWLYDMTVTNRNYRVGAVIGIMIFLIMTFFSLIVFNSSKSMKEEDSFK